MLNIFDLIIVDNEVVSLADVQLDAENQNYCTQLISEHRFANELRAYGLPVVNKLLLHGASGCGKTMTAKAIANELGKKIFILNLSNIISARLGETAQHVKQIFDKAAKEQAILLIDEFDQISKARRGEHDSGELRRLVNSIIQCIDYFPINALLICATNHPEIIDPALLRRFEMKFAYQLPSRPMLDQYYNQLLSPFPSDVAQITRKYDISYAEAKDYAFNLIKSKLIAQLESKHLSHVN